MPAGGRLQHGLGRTEQLMALAAALLGACILALVLGLAGAAGQRADAARELSEARAARLAVYGLLQASVDAETGQRGYLLTGDAQFLAPYEAGRAAALEHLARLRQAAIVHPVLGDDVSRAETLVQEAFAQLAAPLQQRPSRQALQREVIASKQSMDGLRAQARSLLNDVDQLVEAARFKEQRRTARLYWLSGALALLAMVALGLTAWALYAERKTWRATFSALSAARGAAEDARGRAAASDLAKSRFLAVASHDMRQPLHALTLYLSALDRRVENPEARAILTKMERATDSMIAMFSTLLDLARIQAGAVAPEISDFALQDVFDRLAAENPNPQVEVASTPLQIRSDPVLIERALRNLIANAVKHGGGAVRLSARAAGERAEIAVSDQGPGIDPEDHQRIFDEFVRLDTRGDGLGLGLAVVRGIAQALDAPLELDSAPGRGARFVLRPLLAQDAAAPADPAVARGGLRGLAVLVLDDEQIAREAATRALSDLGADVQAAASEAEANRLLDQGFAPRLLVMDLRIDGALQGVDIGRRLRARVSPVPRMIVLTGDTAPETLAMLQASGFAWLIKPVNPRQLSELAAAQFAEQFSST
jgi:signal transduction histidine kinase